MSFKLALLGQQLLLRKALRLNIAILDVCEFPAVVNENGVIEDPIAFKDRSINEYADIMGDLVNHCSDVAKEKEAFYVS